MPWTTPTTAVAGNAILASLWNSDVRDNSLMGNPVFTTEAARDAVITAPVEGQRAYLTAPTVPAATGATTFVPTGVQTIYNGSVWVCVTPVGAVTPAGGTTTSTSYTATLSGSPGTNPTVTLVTGTTALIHLKCDVYNTNLNAYALVGVAVSGAGTVAASDDYAMYHKMAVADNQITYGVSFILGGLTAGTNTFTMQYKVSSNTGTFAKRSITVQGIA